MEIKEINNLKIWTDFFNQNGSPSFLQSWEWGELQKKMGYQILRLGIYNKNKLTAISLVIKIRSKRGNFLFIPHGPIIKTVLLKDSLLKKIILHLKNQFKKENYSFIRIAPVLENIPENKKIFQKLGFKMAPIYMHAETVWVLPFFDESIHRNLTEEELLVKMRKTTRYSIRKAVRDGVLVEKRTDEKAVDDFYKVYKETAKRENFVPFSKDYIQKEFEEFNKTGNALFLFARVCEEAMKTPVLRQSPEPPPEARVRRSKNTVSNLFLASTLIIFTKSTAFYHQGASIHTKVPATYLLQWEAIKEAKKRGCKSYNFWGIYDEQSKRMPKAWKGLTLFKTGFGGKKICYLPTQDYIISPKYYLTFFLEKLLSWKRGV